MLKHVDILLEVEFEQQGAARPFRMWLQSKIATSRSDEFGPLPSPFALATWPYIHQYSISDTGRHEHLGTRRGRLGPLVYTIHQADQYKTYSLS